MHREVKSGDAVQAVQNAAARVVTGARQFDHFTGCQFARGSSTSSP